MKSKKKQKSSSEKEANSPSVPKVTPTTPLKIEQAKAPATEVPLVETESPLKIEKESIIEGEEPVLDSKNKVIFTFGSIFAVTVVVSTLFFSFLYVKNPPEKKKISSVVVETPKRASTVTENNKGPDKSQWTFEVLNGSGVAGAAASAAKKLEEADFTVVKTGNADKVYETTLVFISRDNLNQSDWLLESLKDEFASASVAGELKDSTATARMIVGLK